MLRYAAVALALKAASFMPRIYRAAGNRFGNRENTGYNRVGCAEFLAEVHRRVCSPDDPVLDLGTGWMNFYAICLSHLRLGVTAYDVIDNRQWRATQTYFRNRRTMIPNAEIVLAANGFEDLYEKLRINYVIAPTLEQFQNNHFQTVFSVATLEHVPRSVIRRQVQDTYRILRPGGYAIHQIDLTDHLSKYDKKESTRRFLAWDAAWPLLFRNDVQYVNRLLRSDFHEMFESTGFLLESEECLYAPLNGTKIAESFRHRSREDLECYMLKVIYRKPSEPVNGD